jgi:hypothetical protein
MRVRFVTPARALASLALAACVLLGPRPARAETHRLRPSVG